MSVNSLKSVENMATYFEEKFNKPKLTSDSWYNASKLIEKVHNDMMSSTKSNVVIIDDLEDYNNEAMFNTEILIKSMNNPNIKLDVGHDRDGDPYMYFDSNNSDLLIYLTIKSLQDINKFTKGKLNKIILKGNYYDNERKMFIETNNSGIFKFSSRGTKPLFMNSRDMATLSVFFENCLIDKLLDM